MFAISYHMQSGSTVHRARSAAGALEAIALISAGGGKIDRIVVTGTGEQISPMELSRLAADDARADAAQAPRIANPFRLFLRQLMSPGNQ